MGRHSGAPAAIPEPDPRPGAQPAPRPSAQPAPRPAAGPAHPGHHPIERVALAAGAAVATGAVMAWAGAQPLATLLGAAGCAVVVLVASWMANSLPANPHTRRDSPPGREP